MSRRPLGCEHCEFGWRSVRLESVEAANPRPVALDDEALSDEDRARITLTWQARLASGKNTVYPCKECNPDLFYRWAKGHLDSAHERAGCAECLELDHPRRGSRKAAAHEPEPDHNAHIPKEF